MNPKTVGLVFLKCRDGKISELHERISQLMDTFSPEQQKDFAIDFAIRIVGCYDCLVSIRGNEAESISDFVLMKLRKPNQDVIADTQTFIGWPIGERVEAFLSQST